LLLLVLVVVVSRVVQWVSQVLEVVVLEGMSQVQPQYQQPVLLQ
jgi:hypothetical protein